MQAAQTELVSNLIYWAVLTYAFTFIQFWVGGKSYEKKEIKMLFVTIMETMASLLLSDRQHLPIVLVFNG